MKHFGSNLLNCIHCIHIIRLPQFILISIFLFSFQNTYAKNTDLTPQEIGKFDKFVKSIETHPEVTPDNSGTMKANISKANQILKTVNITKDNLFKINNLLDCIYSHKLTLTEKERDFFAKQTVLPLEEKLWKALGK